MRYDIVFGGSHGGERLSFIEQLRHAISVKRDGHLN